MPPSLAIVPAAGRSERFGGMKLLVDVGGEALLDRTLRSLLEAGLDRVAVVVAPGATLAPVRLLRDHRVVIVVNPDPARGMFSSIQTGFAASAGHPIAILPGDMPFVRASTVAVLFEQCLRDDAAVVAGHGGRRGHPLVLPGRLRHDVLAADPASTLKDALASMGVALRMIETDDPGVLRDVDRKEDLAFESTDAQSSER